MKAVGFFSNCQFTAVALMTVFAIFSNDVYSQELSREVREKFEAMVDDLDGSLQRKFQTAIDNNTPVVELTPNEFRKFRDNPVNPFDINDVDPDDLDGNIELRFELPSLRNRPVRRYERQSRSLRRSLRSAVDDVFRSVVKVTDGDLQLALGTIVSTDGLVVTKASEIADRDQLYCVLGQRSEYLAKVLNTNKENDIALLKIDVEGLTPIQWATTQPLNGAFVVTPDSVGQIVSLGSYSVVSRSTVGENQGFLGVAPQSTSRGVRIVDSIESDTAAYAAGLQKDDVITAIDGKNINEAFQLAEEMRKRHAGDQVRIDFLRDGRSRETIAKLAGRTINGERAARFKMMSRLGAIPSERKSGFPSVFQHDSPLFPEQCGGPICDLSGNVLGINIARSSRAATYAIPSSHIRKLVEEMIGYSVASRKVESR